MSYRPTRAEVSIQTLKDNLTTLRNLECSQNFFCPMIKANAYGHGDLEIAQLLEEQGIEYAGVALVEEGEWLRQNGINQLKILVFGHFDQLSADRVVKNQLTPVLSSWQQLKALDEVLNVDSRFKVHLKFNTGMNRQGFPVNEAEKLAEYFRNQSQLELEGLCTHFAEAEKFLDSKSSAQAQLKKFEDKVVSQFADFPVVLHTHNSAAMLCSLFLPELRKYGARPGIAFYGYPPEIENLNDSQLSIINEINITPALELFSEVIQINDLDAGDIVSYGAMWKATTKSKVAVVPIGYGDGYHRNMSGQAKALVQKHRLPVIGRICMDYIMLDVTHLSEQNNVRIGDEVCLISASDLTADELATWADTIGYEVLTGISSRVPRVYK